jgi:hypothetical protein
MQRIVTAIVLIAGICMAVAARAQTPTCPVSDVRAAVSQACSCTAFPNHGQFMKCVRGQTRTLRKQGCDTSGVVNCAARSICGKPRSPIVCCKKNGRATVTSGPKCTAREGTVMTGINSPCDAGCPTPVAL